MKRFIFSFILLSLFTCFIVKSSFASGFSNLYIRLDHQTANAVLSGTLCANPSSAGAGVENSVTITFPSDFTISNNTANWTTSVSNLSTNENPWPSVGATANSVSGKSVTFLVGNLTANNTYCFNFSSSLSTTGTTGDGKLGTVVTKDNSNSTIDSTTYSLSITSNNQISVTASIDPKVVDLPIQIEALTAGSNFPQNSTLSYQITYGTNTIGPVPLTIQAQWSQGTIEGSPSPSVDVVDYLVGSASTAYNSTPAVIDTVNRTITWTISSIPGGTLNRTVTFSLKTNDNYTGSSIVNFDISARAISGSTVTPDSTVTQSYLFSQTAVTLTPSPTSAPSANITTTPTPTTTITPEALNFTDVSITAVSQSEAQIHILTNNNSILTFQYGQTTSNLSKIIRTLNYVKENTLNISGLSPDTDYYFKISAKDENGKIITSDIFTFHTAVVSVIPTIEQQSILITSSDNVLLNSQTIAPIGQGRTNTLVIPSQSIFVIQFSLNKKISLKSIQAIIRNKKVLGFSTTSIPDASSNYVNLVETQPGVYTGKLASPQNPGEYEVFVKLIDYNGNLSEQKILDLFVTHKFKILSKYASEPIENARLLLSIYNKTTRIYSIIAPQILPIQNPTYSAPDGSYNIVLPPGKYKAEISAIGYSPQTIEFEIDPYKGGYPTVYLYSTPFNILNTISYYTNIISDSIEASQTYIREHSNSSRLFDLITTGSLFIFVIITLIAFTARTHVSLFYIPYFLIYKFRIILKKENPLMIFGKVINNKTKLPISKAIVYLTNPENGKIEAMLKTNKLGEFYYEEEKDKQYKISVMKKGYTTSKPIIHKNNNTQSPVVVNLDQLETERNNLLDTIIIYIEDLIGVFLEFLIVLGLFFEIYFSYTFGILRILPFLIISIITFLLLMIFIYKPQNLEEKN